MLRGWQLLTRCLQVLEVPETYALIFQAAAAPGQHQAAGGETGLPQSLGQLTALRQLKLRSYPTSSLPAAMASCTSLTHLDVSSCRLGQWPPVLQQLTALQELSVAGNALLDGALAAVSFQGLAGLTSLNLSSIGGGSGPLRLAVDWASHGVGPFSASGLAACWFPDSPPTWHHPCAGMAQLPASISNLTSLQALHLQRNRLALLPAAIGHLSRLRTLLLGENALAALPDSLSCLVRLEQLSAAGNQLAVLPQGLSCLQALQALLLGENRLASLHAGLCRLTRLLQVLQLQSNQLPVLPSNWCMPELREVDLSCNFFR